MTRIIGQATDKRPGAQGRRGTYDVYEVAGERVHLRLREFLRPDGTVEPLNGLRTDAIWVSRHRYHVHVNRARTWQS